jgi:hypothetical protein
MPDLLMRSNHLAGGTVFAKEKARRMSARQYRLAGRSFSSTL